MIKANIATVETAGEIPEPLASETIKILEIHRANGDLGWVKDMIAELEAQERETPSFGKVKQPSPAPVFDKFDDVE